MSDTVIPRRAWRVTVAGIEAIAAAVTRGRAIMACVRSCDEAGYPVIWKNVRARRAPEYDRWAADMRQDIASDEEGAKEWKTHNPPGVIGDRSDDQNTRDKS